MAGAQDVINYRVRAQQLDRESGTVDDTAVLALGVQDTGPDGASWALQARGVDRQTMSGDELILLWALRGAPHFYRRADTTRVAAALEPYSDADAGKRIFDAAKPLKACGIGNLAALDAIAQQMRTIVTGSMSKGDVSAALAKVMPQPYLRECRVCKATHLYEQPFRLSAVRAGLELRPGTSPPVLEPIPGYAGSSGERGLDPIRGYLRLFGPSTPKQVAAYLDAPQKDVKAHWPQDTCKITVDGETRWMLADDGPTLDAGPVTAVRLLGPFDPFLQAKDRETLVPDPVRAKELWPVLGRPGAVLAEGGLAGTWRARKAGTKLTVTVSAWQELPATTRTTVGEQAERLAASRGLALGAVDVAT